MKRVAKRMGREDLLDGLERIAIDEISYRKHHHYLTLVADHDHRRIVWGKKGKDAETLAAFFEALGEQRCKIIRVVSMDMSKAYIKVVREKLPWAQIVFDRFHVEKLVNDALDKTRREEWQRLRRTDDEKIIKNMRWVLLKRPWDLDTDEWQRLSILQKRNARVYRAYLLKEAFSYILDGRQPNVAKRKLEKWLSWACRSRLPEFVRVARTIRKHLDDIVAYVRHRVTNGLIEGLNNKARLITRRAYGFHSTEATLAMIMLCCSGLELMPVHKVLDLDPHV
jgi:transposase